MNPQDFYRLIFSDILLGYTSTSHSFFGPIFIKHLSYLDMGALDSQYNLYLLKAKSNGILDYKTREIDIIKENLWTQKEERELLDFEKFVTDVKINISKDYLNSRRQRMKKDINDVEKKIDKLKRKKEYYIGQTAESIAHKKLTYSKIIQSYYKDEKLLEKLIDADSEIDDIHYYELIDLYNQFQEKLGNDNLKMLSIFRFFTDVFYLCDDDAFSFYGKPIINLTNYQVEIFSLGRYFKNVISNNPGIPTEILNKPDELMDWLQIQTN